MAPFDADFGRKPNTTLCVIHITTNLSNLSYDNTIKTLYLDKDTVHPEAIIPGDK